MFLILNINFELVVVPFPVGMKSPESLLRFLSESVEPLCSRGGHSGCKVHFLESNPVRAAVTHTPAPGSTRAEPQVS